MEPPSNPRDPIDGGGEKDRGGDDRGGEDGRAGAGGAAEGGAAEAGGVAGTCAGATPEAFAADRWPGVIKGSTLWEALPWMSATREPPRWRLSSLNTRCGCGPDPNLKV